MSRSDQAANYILNRMRRELDGSMYYHNVSHVLDVLHAAEMIGRMEHINDHEMEMLKVAALFHDSGFIISCENHEQRSCELAMEYLPGIGYNNDEINTICNLIMATRVPQCPANHLEAIMCDADLDYLGRDDFFSTGHNIFKEFQCRHLVSSEREWNELQVKFLSEHNYFTTTAKQLRSAKKAEHLQKIKKLLQEKV